MAASSTYELHEKLRTLKTCLRHLTWALEHFDLCSPGLEINGSSGMDHKFCAVVSSQPPANMCFTLLRSLQPHEPPFVSEAPKQPGSSRFSKVLKYNVAETQFCSKKKCQPGTSSGMSRNENLENYFWSFLPTAPSFHVRKFQGFSSTAQSGAIKNRYSIAMKATVSYYRVEIPGRITATLLMWTSSQLGWV